MVIISERVLQSMETERHFTDPAQLPKLTRLDEGMKQIMDFTLAQDQKVLLPDQLPQRYQGFTRQMKNEMTIKSTVVPT